MGGLFVLLPQRVIDFFIFRASVVSIALVVTLRASHNILRFRQFLVAVGAGLDAFSHHICHEFAPIFRFYSPIA